MTAYALVKDGVKVLEREFGEATPPTLPANKGEWYEIEIVHVSTDQAASEGINSGKWRKTINDVPTLVQAKVLKAMALWETFERKHATTVTSHASLLSTLATKRGEIAALSTVQAVIDYDNQAGW
jgi:hypothetical protein